MKKSKVYPIWFLFGAVALYALLFVLPNLMGIYYSLTDWSRYHSDMNFVGLENYKKIFSGGEKYMADIQKTLVFTFVTTILKIIISVALALLLQQAMRGRNLYRTILFLPSVLPFLIIGLIFKSILHPSTGLLNESLRALGLEVLTRQWLVDISTAFGTIIAVDIWRGAGYCMTIVLAGLQSIPASYYEAARIDGANYFKTLRYITLPFLVPSMSVVGVLSIIYGLKVFDIVYVLTNGGPGYATEVLNAAVFKEFANGTFAVGSALSTVMFLFMGVISFFLIRGLNGKEEALQ